MKKQLFAHPYYSRLAPVFDALLKIVLLLMLALCLILAFLAYSSFNSLSLALDTQQQLAQKSKNYETRDTMPDVRSADIKRFNRELEQLQRILPAVSIPPLALLNLIEARLPSDSRLQSFEYVRGSGELILKLQSRKKSSIQAFVSSLEQVKKFHEIQLKEGRPQAGQYIHTVVAKI